MSITGRGVREVRKAAFSVAFSALPNALETDHRTAKHPHKSPTQYGCRESQISMPYRSLLLQSTPRPVCATANKLTLETRLTLFRKNANPRLRAGAVQRHKRSVQR